ncbi:hypothetical protein FOMPIDRAFT_94436 [Fomitopsis schrenkii]|uniref:Uncharacterized protein n=1 Tax=Fomitopsis schrenkii TaxID=2126942 RepID=S8E320_FOMSC|nr:hypothetical protein FOMPIDRAFT_94436 [Fomitopsis schrenkii]
MLCRKRLAALHGSLDSRPFAIGVVYTLHINTVVQKMDGLLHRCHSSAAICFMWLYLSNTRIDLNRWTFSPPPSFFIISGYTKTWPVFV